MRENRPYGSEGGGPQLNAASLPLSRLFRILNRNFPARNRPAPPTGRPPETVVFPHDGSRFQRPAGAGIIGVQWLEEPRSRVQGTRR